MSCWISLGVEEQLEYVFQGIDTGVGNQQVVHLGLSQEWPLQILDASGMPKIITTFNI